MASATSLSLTAAIIEDHVRTPVAKISAELVNGGLAPSADLSPVSFPPQPPVDPTAVDLPTASGGFNSVIEFSADFCFRHCVPKEHTFETCFEPDDEGLQHFLSSQTTPFDHDYLNGLAANISAHKRIPTFCLRLDFEPDHFQLLKPHRLRLKGHAAVGLDEQLFKAPPAPPFLERAALGILNIDIYGEYGLASDFDRKQVNVQANLTAVTVSVADSASDLARFYEHGFFGANGSKLKESILSSPGFNVTPTISLTGAPGKASVPEFSSFEPIAVQLGQTLAVAVQIKPGFIGSVEDIHDFIHGHSYGIISDEYVIEHMFKHKWNQGKFARELSMTAPTKVGRRYPVPSLPGHPPSEPIVVQEDAQVHGVLKLDTLDVVSIETDSVTRTDYLKVGGTATVTPQFIKLTDGTTIGTDKVDLGKGTKTGWVTQVSLRPVTGSGLLNPELAAFVAALRDDAYQYIARPFPGSLGVTSLKVFYARMEGISKHMYCLVDTD